MANNNIYDLIISELILRLEASANSTYSPQLIITNSLNSNTVAENFNGSVTFTSDVINMPTGYSVQGTTHTLTFPNGTSAVSSSSDSVSGLTTMILGSIGTTFVVTSSVTLEHSTNPSIVLTGTQTITSVLPIYYGIKPFESSPSTTSLSTISKDSNSFEVTNSSIGRLFLVIPTTNGAFSFLTGPNGLLIPASDFTLTTVGSLNYWQLNYDTQLTGSNIKNFIINYV